MAAPSILMKAPVGADPPKKILANRERFLAGIAAIGTVILGFIVILVAVLVPVMRSGGQQILSVTTSPCNSSSPSSPCSLRPATNVTSAPLVPVNATTNAPAPVSTVMPTPSSSSQLEPPETSTSTPSPSTSVHVCNVCGEGLEIGARGNSVGNAFTSDEITCSELEERGSQGYFDSIQCQLIKASAPVFCRCQPAPSAASDAPSFPSFKTLAPSPMNFSTPSPSNSPTSEQIISTEQPVLGTPPPTEALAGNSSSLTYYPGLLTESENGLILSQGLHSSVFARTGSKVTYSNGETSALDVHSKPDFGGCFADPRPNNVGGWIYVSNSENRAVGNGGVGAFTFNKDGVLIDYSMVLTGTKSNCGGGKTPWGAWISCEENDEGRCWQVDPTGGREAGPITLGSDRGRFESFAYDLTGKDSPQFFITEDNDDGALQRFRPDNPNWEDPWSILYGTGTTDYLILKPDTGTFFFTADKNAAKENALQYFRGSEGIDVRDGILYFVSKKEKILFILNLHDNTYTNHSTVRGAFDAQPDQVARVIESSDLLFFTEDGRQRPGIHARDKKGAFFTILEGLDGYGDESTGKYEISHRCWRIFQASSLSRVDR